MKSKKTPSDVEKMKIEKFRVEALLQVAVEGVDECNGDIRFFSAAFLTAAIQLHVEVEGPEALDQAITKIGSYELSKASGRRH